MKRIISLVLVMALAMSMLMVCSGTAVAEDLTTIKILCQIYVNDETTMEQWDTYSPSQIVIAELAELGLRLEFECVDDVFQTAQTRLAGGIDLPDIISLAFGDDNACLDLGKAGSVCDVVELVEEYDEDNSIIDYYEEVAPGVWNSKMTPEGKRYWFSYFVTGMSKIAEDKATGVQYVNCNPYALSLRKDWVEAMGEEFKAVYTPEDVFDLVQMMQDNDVNGNGLKDEVIAVDIDGFGNGIAQAFGLGHKLLMSYYVDINNDDEKGGYTCNFYNENLPDYLRFMNSLYEAGLFTTDDTDELTAQNRAAALYQQYSWNMEANMVNADPDTIYYAPMILDLDGNVENGFTVTASNVGSAVYSQFMIPTGAEHKKEAIELMDYVYTKKWAIMSEYGIEGVGFDYNENGVPVRKVDSSFDYPDALPLSRIGLALYGLPRSNVYGTVKEFSTDGMNASMKNRNEWGYAFNVTDKTSEYGLYSNDPLLALPSEEESAIISSVEATLTTYGSELLVAMILGEKNIDDLDMYIAEMNELGLADYVEAMTARYERANG